jgi:transcriptional regulator with XRE-family HTH domain
LHPVHRGREEFGGRLRALREEARLTGTALAARLGWPNSKVSKIEHGRQTATADDVTAWVAAVDGSADLLADLLADLRSVRLEYRSWARMLRRGTAARQRAVVPLDASTSLLRAFEPALVPGLLQTAEYARWVLLGVVRLRDLPDDVTQGVKARLERQQALYDPGKQFRFLITDAGLRYLVCPPEVLRGQLDRLLTVAGLPNVELGVLRFTAQLPYPALHGFWIYDDKLVLVNTVSAELSLRDGDDVAVYEKLFEMLWGRAVVGSQATAAISAAERELSHALPGG